jgi:hypothetical protein
VSTAERLLDLTVEYQQARAARSVGYEDIPGTPVGREPAEIAEDYAAALRDLLGAQSANGGAWRG